MTRVETTLANLKTNFSGQPWHGTALRLILDGIAETKSASRPIRDARTIAELLGHVIAWNEIVGRRIAGEIFEVTAEMDFPDVSNTTWNDLLKRLDAAHAKLIEVVSRLQDEDLDRTVPGKKHSFSIELHGLMHHNTYHGAQIALLKKA